MAGKGKCRKITCCEVCTHEYKHQRQSFTGRTFGQQTNESMHEAWYARLLASMQIAMLEDREHTRLVLAKNKGVSRTSKYTFSMAGIASGECILGGESDMRGYREQRNQSISLGNCQLLSLMDFLLIRKRRLCLT